MKPAGSTAAGRAMKVVLNGQEREVEPGTSILGLLGALGLDPKGVAVERNREIAKKQQYGATVLCEGDVLEVVHFVGGG